MPARIEFTEAQIDQIKQLFAQGCQERDIAKKLDCTRAVIRRVIRELDMRNTITIAEEEIFTPEQLVAIQKLFDEGHGTIKIAKTWNVSRHSIQQAFKKMGLKRVMPRIELSSEQLNKVQELFDKGYGTRKIAKELNIHRGWVKRAFEILGLSNESCKKMQFTTAQLQIISDMFYDNQVLSKIAQVIGVSRTKLKDAFTQLNINTSQRTIPQPLKERMLPTERQCRRCSKVLSIEQFAKRERKDRNNIIEYSCYCSPCDKERAAEYRKNNPEKRKQALIKYAAKEETKKKRQEYYENNKEYFDEKRRERDRIKRQTDPVYRLRHRISCMIWQKLFKEGGDKGNNSCLEFLEWTIPELKKWLEDHFEPWMTWDNYGPYRKAMWNDDDRTTWTWNIDHIIPHSMLPYSSLEDDNFKKCWALSNLRPYSAKQNFLDGISRVRHKVNK